MIIQLKNDSASRTNLVCEQLDDIKLQTTLQNYYPSTLIIS